MSRQKAAGVGVGDVGGAEEGGEETFYSLLRQSSSAMKNAWNISQEHNYLHGSED